jgi:hypothetical protein
MGYRRSPDRVAARRNWQHILQSNASLVEASGLPPNVTAAIESWDDLLMHGLLTGDAGGFSVEQLSPEHYRALVELAHNYFDAGYEFYSPSGLHTDDQAALRHRFGLR